MSMKEYFYVGPAIVVNRPPEDKMEEYRNWYYETNNDSLCSPLQFTKKKIVLIPNSPSWSGALRLGGYGSEEGVRELDSIDNEKGISFVKDNFKKEIEFLETLFSKESVGVKFVVSNYWN